MALVSPDGEWLDVNPALCQIFGYTKEELIKDNIRRITHPDDLELSNDIIADFNSGKLKSLSTEKRYINKSGEVIWAQLTTSAIHENGQLKMFVSQIQDITESIKTQQKLINASKMAALGEMAAGIAHEINNPLTVIEGNASVLKVSFQKAGIRDMETYERLNRISSTVDRISSIVDGMRNFSRTGRQNEEDCVLEDVVNETLSLCREKLVRSGVVLSTKIATDLRVKCNRLELSQVLLNLISNANDALESSTEKRIEVTTFKASDGVKVQVKDTGPGVAPKIREKIMHSFFTTKPLGKGTGLGLSLSKEMMERMGGDLRLMDSARGACFVITVPFAKDQKRSVA